jgi:hypothetical protein
MRARRCGTAALENRSEIIGAGHEIEENEPGVADQVYVETCDEHILLRESLIQQFWIRWERKQVEWLQYPGKISDDSAL